MGMGQNWPNNGNGSKLSPFSEIWVSLFANQPLFLAPSEYLSLRPCGPRVTKHLSPTMFRRATSLLARPILSAGRARSFSTDLPANPTADSAFVDAWKKVVPNIDPPKTPLTFMKPRPPTPSSIPSKLTVNFVLPYASELSAKEVAISIPVSRFCSVFCLKFGKKNKICGVGFVGVFVISSFLFCFFCEFSFVLVKVFYGFGLCYLGFIWVWCHFCSWLN